MCAIGWRDRPASPAARTRVGDHRRSLGALLEAPIRRSRRRTRRRVGPALAGDRPAPRRFRPAVRRNTRSSIRRRNTGRRFWTNLAGMKRAGIADVDIHIHHDGEGQQNFVDRMSGFIETLVARHGLLRQPGRPHRSSASSTAIGRSTIPAPMADVAASTTRSRCCAISGCYADFTMPSGNSPTQARTVNTIYWVTDDPLRPRSYDYGVPVLPGARLRRPAHDPRPFRLPLDRTPHIVGPIGQYVKGTYPKRLKHNVWHALACKIKRMPSRTRFWGRCPLHTDLSDQHSIAGGGR